MEIIPSAPTGTPAPVDRWLTLPNLISATRLPLAVVFTWVIDLPAVAIAILLLAGFTDMLDGLVARRSHLPTHLGAIVDPIFDKLFVLIAVASLVWSGRITPLELVILTVRDWLVTPMALGIRFFSQERRARLTLKSNYFGKATTVMQFFALVAALARPSLVWPLALLSGALGLVCVMAYFMRGWREAFGAR